MGSLRTLAKQIYVLRPTIENFRRQKPFQRYLQEIWVGISGCHRCRHKRQNCLYQRLLSVGLAILAIVSLTAATGYSFYTQTQLAAETIATQTIQAPRDATFEDTASTEAKRQQAEKAAAGAWVIAPQVTRQITQSLSDLLVQGNTIRRLMGLFPFELEGKLSLSTQRYLRQTDEQSWLAILRTVNTSMIDSPVPATVINVPNPPASNDYRRAVLELQAYRESESSSGNMSVLLQIITEAREKYAIARTALQNLDNQIYDESFLALTDSDWSITQSATTQALDRILAQGVHPGYNKTMQQSFITLQLHQTVPTEAEPLAHRLIAAVLRPNLEKDEQESQRLAREAAAAIAPETISIKQGEIIIQAGQPITAEDLAILKHFNLNKRQIYWGSLWGLAGFVSLAVGGFWITGQRIHGGLRHRDYLLILLLSLSAPLLLLLDVNFTSMQAIGLLLGSFYGSAIGIVVVVMLAVLLPIGTDIALSHLIPSAVGGILGSLIAGQLRFPFSESSRTREELALMGGAVGLTQGAVYFLLNTKFTALWYTELQTALLSGLTGLAWSIIALGLSPYLERLFDLVTPIRLAELANPNRPLLRRLALETPGTFQHTLHVATLAEAAARALGCNVELVRTGTLYHDIGKMHDPLGFIENQMGGANKHDAIQDPWISAGIIKKHVSEGIVMARKCQLPTAVRAFIPEHQGTGLMTYFYHQAKQIAEQNPGKLVLETDFRYDGPIPQSRETGIVMLADSCEAALRSLKEASPQEALAVINRILRAKWQDEQLVDSGLTRNDLAQIADVFVQVWQQFHHQRIAYPTVVR